jgi:hypothetical protein
MDFSELDELLGLGSYQSQPTHVYAVEGGSNTGLTYNGSISRPYGTAVDNVFGLVGGDGCYSDCSKTQASPQISTISIFDGLGLPPAPADWGVAEEVEMQQSIMNSFDPVQQVQSPDCGGVFGNQHQYQLQLQPEKAPSLKKRPGRHKVTSGCKTSEFDSVIRSVFTVQMLTLDKAGWLQTLAQYERLMSVKQIERVKQLRRRELQKVYNQKLKAKRREQQQQTWPQQQYSATDSIFGGLT